MKRAAFSFHWFLFGLVVVASATFGSNPATPPEQAQVIGVWVGYTDHCEFVRLELDGDSTGYVSLGSLGDSTFDTHRVHNWALREWNVTMELTPVSAAAEPIKVDKVGCYLPNLEVQFSGATNDWSRKATLWNERALRASAKKAADAISKARKKR